MDRPYDLPHPPLPPTVVQLNGSGYKIVSVCLLPLFVQTLKCIVLHCILTFVVQAIKNTFFSSAVCLPFGLTTSV